MSTLLIPTRFAGPPTSGNGGWTAGELATHVEHGVPADHAGPWPAIQVTLRKPPPLETTMSVITHAGVTALVHDDAVVGEAVLVEGVPAPVPPVSYEVALAAQERYAGRGLDAHPFGHCFACGPARAEGDGLQIFPGEVDPVDGQRRVASAWTPHPSVAEEPAHHSGNQPRTSVAVAWAALDCIGGWAEDLIGRPMVLGRMTARLESLPVVGEPHVVVGQHLGSEGRRTFTAATLYDSAGAVVGVAGHVWFQIDPATFG